MGNFEEHLIVGALAGVFSSQSLNSSNQDNLLSNIFWSCLGASVPDVLEPADSPNHRKFFHSVSFQFLSSKILLGILQDSNVKPEIKNIITPLIIGYSSHLLLDLSTPKGLPILGLVGD